MTCFINYCSKKSYFKARVRDWREPKNYSKHSCDPNIYVFFSESEMKSESISLFTCVGKNTAWLLKQIEDIFMLEFA